MKTLTMTASLAALLLACAPAANAAKYMSFTPPAGDGSIAGVFGNNGGIAAGDFTDTFNFTWPAAGHTSGTISSSFTASTDDLDFSSVTLNGAAFTTVSGGPGVTEFRLITNKATMAGPQVLVVNGHSPGTSATYSGTLSFSPDVGVPEPASWALMILGFAGAGGALRSRRRLGVPA